MAYLELSGVRTYFDDVGDGQSIVLLHGWGQSAEMWSNIKDTLALYSRVIIPDLPGFGKSGTPLDDWGIKEYSLWLQSFLKALGIQNPNIMGHSFGGVIGLSYSNLEQVDTLFLYSSAPCVVRRSIFTILNIVIIKTVQHIFPTFLYYAQCRFLHPQNYTNFVECSRVRAMRMLTIYTKKNADIKGPFQTKKILTISGTKDWIVSEKRCKESANELGAKRYVITGAGHFAHITHRAEFLSLIGINE